MPLFAQRSVLLAVLLARVLGLVGGITFQHDEGDPKGLSFRKGSSTSTQQLWQHSAADLDRLYEPCDSDLCRKQVELFSLFKPCTRCLNVSRYGDAGDGGYSMCEGLGAPTVAAYSLGIDGRDDWGADVSDRFNVTVHEYDCMNTTRPLCPEPKSCSLVFHEQCVVGGYKMRPPGTSLDYQPLHRLMEANGHHAQVPGAVPNLLAKLDVEGSEWGVFVNPMTAEVISRFSQLIVEFHEIGHSNLNLLDVQIAAMRNLLRGFDIALLHGNNWRPMVIANEFQIPSALEVLFVNRRLATGVTAHECQADPPYYPPNTQNNPLKPPLPPMHLAT